MYQCKIIQYLRQKHGISAREMSKAMGISQPRYFRIENENAKATYHLRQITEKGFETIIENRKESIEKLKTDYIAYKDSLLEWECY